MKEKDIINKKLVQLKAPFDKKEMWNNIQNNENFPKPKKKNKALPWFFVLSLIACLGLLWWVNADKTTTSTSVTSKDLSSINTPEKTAKSALKTKQLNENSTSNSSSRLNINSPIQKTKTSINKPTTSSEINKEVENKNNIQKPSKTIKKDDKKDYLITDTQSIYSNSASNSSSILLNNKVTKKEETHEVPMVSNSSPSIDNNSFNNNNQAPKNYEKNKFNTLIHKENNNSTHARNKSVVTTGTIHKRITPIAISSIKTMEFFLLKRENKAYAIDQEIYVETGDMTPKKWALEIKLGMGYAYHQKQAFQDQSLASFNFQNQYTNTIESYLAEINLKRRLTKKWNLGFGIQYYNSFQRFSLDTTGIENIREKLTSQYQFKQEVTSKTFTFYQKHHFVDLKLLLYRDFKWKNNEINIGAGLGYNVGYSFNGSSIDRNETTYDINKDNGYKTRLGHHYIIELGYNKKLTNRISWSTAIEMKSRFQLRNKTNSHAITPFHFKSGISYRF